MTTDEFKKMLDQLRSEYLDALPATLKAIEKLIQNKQEALLREEVHKLKGSGATYGIPEISELCEVMETICINGQGLTYATTTLDLLNRIYQHRRLENSPLTLKDCPDFIRLKNI